MERRDPITAPPYSTNSLLSRQFASITKVLLEASERHDRELRQRPLRPTPTLPTPRFTYELPATSEPELSRGNEPSDDCVELEHVHTSNEGMAGDESTAFDSAMGLLDTVDTKVHLRGGYVSDYADDAKIMLVELNSLKQKTSGSGVKEELDNVDVVGRTQVDLENLSSLSEGTAVVRDDDAKGIPRKLSMDEEDDIDEQDELSALAERLGVDDKDSEALGDAKSMLGDFDKQGQGCGTSRSEDEDDSLETLHGKLATMLSLSCDIVSQDLTRTAKDTSVADTVSNLTKGTAELLESVPTPSIIASRSDTGNAELETVKGWCTQLSGNGTRVQETNTDKEDMVKRENEKLEATIKYVLQEEKRYRAIEATKHLPTRLIVSNLAADVDDEAIRLFFASYRREICNVTILPSRDPVRRIRMAYVDMYSRKMAIRASYEVGGIFGLIVKIKLAVELEEGLEG